MAEKRFYWIKLKENFMTSDTVDFLMGQKNGANYVVLYQMLCLKTANTNGALVSQIGEVIVPYDIAKIERDCKYFETDTIVVAMELYKKLGLIYEQQDGYLQISGFEELIGSEGGSAERMRKKRAIAKKEGGLLPSHCANNVRTIKNKEKVIQKETNTEINTEIDIETELDKKIDTDSLTDCQNSADTRAKEETEYYRNWLSGKINESFRLDYTEMADRFLNLVDDISKRKSISINGLNVPSQDVLRTLIWYVRTEESFDVAVDLMGHIGYRVQQGEVHNQQFYTISTLYTVARNNGGN